MALMPFVYLVQDFYNVTIPLGSSTQAYIDAKFEATTAHITNATLTTLNPDQLYISFASASFSSETPQVAI
jgi:1-phosphatidylinositol phosphodiesterase